MACFATPPRRSQKHSASPAASSVQLVFYDFDQTISKLHLYERLDGGDTAALEKLTDHELIAVFGGEDRVAALHTHFSLLRSANITMGIVSMNYVTVIKKALDRIGRLGQFFCAESIIGRDSDIMRQANNNKGDVISQLMQRNGIGYDQALFVDDSAQNIKQAQGICSTMRVSAQRGMDAGNMRDIEQRIDRTKAIAEDYTKELADKRTQPQKLSFEDEEQPSNDMAMDMTPLQPKRNRSLFTSNTCPADKRTQQKLSFEEQPSNGMAMDITPAQPKRNRSLFTANASPGDDMDITSMFSTMSVTQSVRTTKRRGFCEDDDKSGDEGDGGDDDDDGDGTGGFLLSMFCD